MDWNNTTKTIVWQLFVVLIWVQRSRILDNEVSSAYQKTDAMMKVMGNVK